MQEKEITSIKFFWNGFKLNGNKSLDGKVFYEFVDEDHSNGNSSKLIQQISEGIYPNIDVMARYCDLPDCIFWNVENDSDLYTDYYDDDSACVSPDHPLYKYILYAAAQAKIRDLKSSIAYNQKALADIASGRVRGDAEYIKSSTAYHQKNIDDAEKNLAVLQTIKNPGHPSVEETADCIAKYQQHCEEERHAAELKEEQEREEQRKKFETEKTETQEILSKDLERYPLSDEDPYYVQFLWSEAPAFYDLCDDRPENKKILKTSIEAAEHIAKDLDEYYNPEQVRPHCYEKTAFEIYSKDGERLWEGRLDLGDELGGLFTHLQSWADGLRKYAGQFGIKTKEQDLEDADNVEEFIAELQQSIHISKPAAVYKIDLKSFKVTPA